MALRYKILVGVVACFFAALGFHTSAADIEACKQATGWTAERCAVELTR